MEQSQTKHYFKVSSLNVGERGLGTHVFSSPVSPYFSRNEDNMRLDKYFIDSKSDGFCICNVCVESNRKTKLIFKNKESKLGHLIDCHLPEKSQEIILDLIDDISKANKRFNEKHKENTA